MFEQLKEPKAIGSLCAIALVLLIVGWKFLPKSKAQDIKHYRALKEILDEVRAKRNGPDELAALKTKATKVAREIADVLKDKASREEPAKQFLLWAARDEFPRAAQAGFATESKSEKMFASRLQEAAWELGLERRPPIPPSVNEGAPLPDD